MRQIYGIVLVVLCVTTFVSAQGRPLTENQARAVQELDRASDSLDVLQKTFEAAMAERRAQCKSAIGSAEFCGCLGETLPVGASFLMYVMVASDTYDPTRVSADDRKLIPKILESRDKCIAKVFPPAR